MFWKKNVTLVVKNVALCPGCGNPSLVTMRASREVGKEDSLPVTEAVIAALAEHVLPQHCDEGLVGITQSMGGNFSILAKDLVYSITVLKADQTQVLVHLCCPEVLLQAPMRS
ncbi:MAG: hypothetical protein ABH814_02205 [bacterium]